MRIGVDFDNTIANYDGVFHAAALDLGLISAEIETTKNAVRDHLNGSGRKDAFTELQGYIYGARMDLVSPYPGVVEFFADACARGHSVFVVSHKTRTPLMGPAYDMHEAARGFLEAHGFFAAGSLRRDQTFFEITKEEKVARAAALEVDVFIDDLPEILAMEGFPPSCRRILFDPTGYSGAGSPAFERLSSWRDIHAELLAGS
ncbi:MAG: HAD family hydrolase [Alphaproteobacteria bacterium]|nr:HAD family hydrolase [Alphaproteobacteria bacterium]